MFFINKVKWNIVFVPFNSYQLLKSDGQLTFATCDDITKTIYINNQIYGKFLKKVLCHEITHAAMFSYGISLTVDQEELLADLIATYGDEIIYTTNKIFQKLTGE
ncbi:MAG: hypothetical protein MSA65_03565 [Mollicutes bacterium]|nr:hypothetical protein [Mollicutes bacterium]